MFVVTLKFADKAKAPSLMDGHNAWIARGFDEGVFLLAGGLAPAAGGAEGGANGGAGSCGGCATGAGTGSAEGATRGAGRGEAA